MSDLIRIMSGDGKAIGETVKLPDGTPMRRFKRYVAKVGGTYYKKDWKEPWSVTEDVAAHLCSTWQQMQDVGHPVKITVDHKDSEKAGNVIGDAVDIGIEQVGKDRWIFCDHNVRGEDNIKLAEANKDVSVEVFPTVKTGANKIFRDAIKAISYTGTPLVGGQPIAASTSDDSEDVYFLSTETPMDAILKDAIAKLAGVKADTVTEANAASLIDTARATATAEIKKLSTADEPDIRYLSLAARSGEMALDALATDGVADVATVEGLKKLAIGTKDDSGKRTFSKVALLLSTQDDEAVVNVCETLAKLLRSNKPVATGAKLLSTQPRFVPDGDNKTGTRKVTSPYTGNEVEVNA